jgi:hypothetical protein
MPLKKLSIENKAKFDKFNMLVGDFSAYDQIYNALKSQVNELSTNPSLIQPLSQKENLRDVIKVNISKEKKEEIIEKITANGGSLEHIEQRRKKAGDKLLNFVSTLGHETEKGLSEAFDKLTTPEKVVAINARKDEIRKQIQEHMENPSASPDKKAEAGKQSQPKPAVNPAVTSVTTDKGVVAPEQSQPKPQEAAPSSNPTNTTQKWKATKPTQPRPKPKEVVVPAGEPAAENPPIASPNPAEEPKAKPKKNVSFGENEVFEIPRRGDSSVESGKGNESLSPPIAVNPRDGRGTGQSRGNSHPMPSYDPEEVPTEQRSASHRPVNHSPAPAERLNIKKIKEANTYDEAMEVYNKKLNSQTTEKKYILDKDSVKVENGSKIMDWYHPDYPKGTPKADAHKITYRVGADGRIMSVDAGSEATAKVPPIPDENGKDFVAVRYEQGNAVLIKNSNIGPNLNPYETIGDRVKEKGKDVVPEKIEAITNVYRAGKESVRVKLEVKEAKEVGSHDASSNPSMPRGGAVLS